MRTIVAILAIAIVCENASAQRVFQMGNEYVVSEMGGLSLTPLEDHFGDDAQHLIGPINQALENVGDDSFKLEFKKVVSFGFAKTDNSCAVASNNLIDDIRGNDALSDGWRVRQVGTLGTMTNAMSKVETWFSGQDLDPLNPPSYAHTLSILESPDGNFYTIDNWSSGGLSVQVHRVYPLGDDNMYFTSDPNETDIRKAQIRVQDTDRGKCAYEEDCTPEEDEDSPVSPIPPSSEPAEVEVLTSADPNDKIGMWGVGEHRYILPGRRMDYIIRFENMPDASAPAQEVLIRDTLDVRSFDLTTFELGDVTFSGRTVPVPPGQRSYFTRVPLDDPRFELLIDANLVLETGIVTWRFTTYDPEINDHLGDGYWRTGRKLEAIYQWSHALGLEPDDALKAAVEEKLDDWKPAIGRYGKVMYAVFAPTVKRTTSSDALARDALKAFGGGGGGRPEFAQGGGVAVEQVPALLAYAVERLC